MKDTAFFFGMYDPFIISWTIYINNKYRDRFLLTEAWMALLSEFCLNSPYSTVPHNTRPHRQI